MGRVAFSSPLSSKDLPRKRSFVKRLRRTSLVWGLLFDLKKDEWLYTYLQDVSEESVHFWKMILLPKNYFFLKHLQHFIYSLWICFIIINSYVGMYLIGKNDTFMWSTWFPYYLDNNGSLWCSLGLLSTCKLQCIFYTILTFQCSSYVS